MSRAVSLCAAVVLGFAAAGPAAAAPKDRETKWAVSFLAPADGPDAAAADEFALGIEAAFAASVEPRISLRRDALPAHGKMSDAAAAWKKSGAAAVLAWVPDGRTREVEEAAAKAQRPVVVLSPEPTRPSADPGRLTFWAGGVRTPDEALQAMDFLLIPLQSHRPAVLHDGSARGADAAARAMRIHHVSQEPVAPAVLADPFDAAALRAILDGGADGVVYFGGAAGAERLMQAAAAAGTTAPVLLGQGLASGAVPTFTAGTVKSAWALEAECFEDHGHVAAADKPVLDDVARAAGTPLRAATVRGFRAGTWIAEALRAAGSADEKKVAAALREAAHEAARGKKVFDDFGWGNLFRLGAWRSAAERDGPPCVRIRPTLMPMQAMPQVGTFQASAFAWQEGTIHVQCSFGEGAVRTIEKDLQALGLNTGGYESDLEARILDDLMGRFLSRMNRLFLRNPDGTAIPGRSFRVSFTTAPPSKQVKGVKLKAFLAGDDPEAGGRASGVTANIFTTYIQRTIYLPQKLNPAIAATDRPFLSGTYRWNASLAENLRCDAIRALVDGYSQGLSLTGAHEVGHLCGLGHDTESPRSIMNVAEAVGLDFDWAEWIPAHAKTVESFLGREPAERP